MSNVKRYNVGNRFLLGHIAGEVVKFEDYNKEINSWQKVVNGQARVIRELKSVIEALEDDMLDLMVEKDTEDE